MPLPFFAAAGAGEAVRDAGDDDDALRDDKPANGDGDGDAFGGLDWLLAEDQFVPPGRWLIFARWFRGQKVKLCKQMATRCRFMSPKYSTQRSPSIKCLL